MANYAWLAYDLWLSQVEWLSKRKNYAGSEKQSPL